MSQDRLAPDLKIEQICEKMSHYIRAQKNLEFQLALWTSSYQILLALGKS